MMLSIRNIFKNNVNEIHEKKYILNERTEEQRSEWERINLIVLVFVDYAVLC